MIWREDRGLTAGDRAGAAAAARSARPMSPELALTITPEECPGSDVHLRIWLGGVGFDYMATAVAACNLIRDWKKKHWYAIELILKSIGESRLLPRLPCEQLFYGP
jgi:hypothetical protein